jgi:hypothetical protein
MRLNEIGFSAWEEFLPMCLKPRGRLVLANIRTVSDIKIVTPSLHVLTRERTGSVTGKSNRMYSAVSNL